MIFRKPTSQLLLYTFVFAVFGIALDAPAALRLPTIFSDRMILQRDRPVRVWGWANAGDPVTVAFAGQKAEAKADTNGLWQLTLQPFAASAEGREFVVSSGQTTLTVHDVLVGDVWHASGQSNMAMSAGNVELLKPLVAVADFPLIRHCTIHDKSAPKPLDALRANVDWVTCSPKTAGGFSAAAFFFARRIHQEIGVPVGIINTARGGQPIETFVPREAFQNDPTLIREREFGEKEDLQGIWHLPGGVRARSTDWLPGRDYNSAIAPITRYTLRGVIWYQGESNSGVGEDPRDYRQKMGALVSGWRSAFEQENLPFYFVQLPGSGASEGWPYLREQQRLSMDLPNVGMAVTIDLEGAGIHPPNKFDVGERLACWALAKEYGKRVAFSGPLIAAADITPPTITIHFTHAESGLMVGSKSGLDAPRETADAPITLFDVADADGNWSPAQAKIAGQTVIVQSEKVSEPTAVRYAYQIAPNGPFLYNRDGLPASPFCSKPELLTYDPQIARYEEKK